MTIIEGILILMFACIGIITLKYLFAEKRIKQLKKYQLLNNQHNLIKSGGTSLYGDKEMLNYNLRSWDGGKNWYAIDQELCFRFGEVKILGEAETIYPGLLKHLKAWNKLTEYVEKNGPLNPTDTEALQLIEAAGFKIDKK